MTRLVVFNTSVVISALLFEKGKLAWLRQHWRRNCIPLASAATTQELLRVLGYPKFGLTRNAQDELLAEYIPYCRTIAVTKQSEILCRDKNGQMFLDLAHAGAADWLVTSDQDLLALAGCTTSLRIATPEAYRAEVSR